MNHLKEFIKQHANSSSTASGRFFTAYTEPFRLKDGVELFPKYINILEKIQDGIPNLKHVRNFFSTVDAYVNHLVRQLRREDGNFTLDDDQKGNLKYSIIFKLSGHILTRSPGATQADMERNKRLVLQSPILTALAHHYFVEKRTDFNTIKGEDFGGTIHSYYEGRYNHYHTLFAQGLANLSDEQIKSKDNFIKVMNCDAKEQFKILPKEYREKLSSELWQDYVALRAQKNPYPLPLSLSKEDSELIASVLSEVKTTSVESMAETMTDRKNFSDKEIAWMKKTLIKDVTLCNEYTDSNLGDATFFDLGTEGDDSIGLKASSRFSSLREFRGELMRQMIREAQGSSSQQTLYESFQTHFRTLKNNAKWIYAQNGLLLGHLTAKKESQPSLVQDFNPGTLVFSTLKKQMIERMDLFGEQFMDALDTRDDLLDHNKKLTETGKQFIKHLVNEVNAFHPMPQNIVDFLNAYRSIDEKLNLIHEQITNKIPYAEGSKQYQALVVLYGSLDKAITNFKKGEILAKEKLVLIDEQIKAETPYAKGSKQYQELVELSDSLKQAISNFKKDGTSAHGDLMSSYGLKEFSEDCDKAFTTASNSPLKHEQGWWSRFIKPLILCVATLCSCFALLTSQNVRDGIRNISSNTPGIKATSEMRDALSVLKANPMSESAEESPTNSGPTPKS